MFPFLNLYPIIQIVTKKISKEYKNILNSLDKQELLNFLEEWKFIYNHNPIIEVSKNKISKNEKMI